MGFNLDDYVEVADRLKEWWTDYPTGRIHTEVVELTETRVTIRAEAYRFMEDHFPAGVGHSYMAIPGSTPYTKGSEIENAETSAVGRALVMAGLSSKRIASRDEVAAKKDSQAPPKEKQGGKGSAGAGLRTQTGTDSEPDTDESAPAQLVNADACPHPEASRYEKGAFMVCGMCGTARRVWD